MVPRSGHGRYIHRQHDRHRHGRTIGGTSRMVLAGIWTSNGDTDSQRRDHVRQRFDYLRSGRRAVTLELGGTK